MRYKKFSELNEDTQVLVLERAEQQGKISEYLRRFITEDYSINAFFEFTKTPEGHHYWETNFLTDNYFSPTDSSLPKISATDDLLSFLEKISASLT